MAGGDLDDDDGITGINVTPLVDVMLVLLIIFMVTANYIAHQAISLQLPKAATGADPGPVSLGLSLTKDSVLYLDGKKIQLSDLKGIIEAERNSGKKPQALISADKATPHGSVVKLIDTVKKNGITDIAFNVELETVTQ